MVCVKIPLEVSQVSGISMSAEMGPDFSLQMVIDMVL
jgi:hypothetical protein